MAHPAIMFSISVSTISITYCFIQLIKKNKRAGSLKQWVRDKYPDAYNSLPWVERKLLISEVGLNIINNKSLLMIVILSLCTKNYRHLIRSFIFHLP